MHLDYGNINKSRNIQGEYEPKTRPVEVQSKYLFDKLPFKRSLNNAAGTQTFAFKPPYTAGRRNG